MITFELPKHTNGESCIAVVKGATRAFTEYADDVLELHGSREGLYALRCVTGQFSYALALDAGQLTELFASLWIYYHELPGKLSTAC